MQSKLSPLVNIFTDASERASKGGRVTVSLPPETWAELARFLNAAQTILDNLQRPQF